MRNSQPPTRFLTDFGRLLADQSARGQALHQQQALANLADYVRTARHHHQLTWAALAQATGKSEGEIYALEHGLFPYTQIDFALLCSLSHALDEEVETLTLLMGRAQLAIPAQPNLGTAAHQIVGHRTNSQRLDNWLATLPGINPLHKRCLNLVDSLQGSRLFCYTRAHIGVSHWMGGSLAVLACLLLLWVSTYSLSGLHHAQSYAMLPRQSFVLANQAAPEAAATHSYVPVMVQGTKIIQDIKTIQGVKSSTQSNMKPKTRPRSTQPIAQAAIDLADEGQLTSTSLLLPSTSVDVQPGISQQCALRVTSKYYTLCAI